MSALLTTLPGDIQGLLLHCSPVLWDDEPCLVQCALDGSYQRVDGDVGGTPEPVELRLDLTDRTGRAHAAWWVIPQILDSSLTADEWFHARQLCARATEGHDMTPDQFDLLARLVLRLAGRTP